MTATRAERAGPARALVARVRRLGPANCVTLARAMLAVGVAALAV
jgi:hypothetical protein